MSSRQGSPVRASPEAFRIMLRAALGEPIETEGRELVFWSNAPGSVENEIAAKRYCAENPKRTILLTDTRAGRVVAELISLYRPSSEQADVIWGLLSHRFAQGAIGTAHAFVFGAPAGRIFRAVEARELGEADAADGLQLHEATPTRFLNRGEVIVALASYEGDFFVTRDPDEQLAVMEEAERFRPRRRR